MKHAPLLRGIGGLVAAYVFAWVWGAFLDDAIYDALIRPALSESYDQFSAKAELWFAVTRVLRIGYGVTLALATLVMPAAWFVRMLFRSRARAGYPDPLEGVRRLTKTHPRTVAVLTALPAGLYFLKAAMIQGRALEQGDYNAALTAFAIPAVVVFLAQMFLLRRGWRALIAPTVSDSEIAAFERSADGLHFRAVAVTLETRATVSAIALFGLGMFIAACWLPVSVLVRSPTFYASLFAYIVVSSGTAVFFVRASRIAVGLDGVYISGSARRRFVPFSDVDGAELHEESLDLMRGARRVLRFQLHGEDALRREALLLRLRGAIALATKQRDEPAVAFVKTGDVERIERAASGASNYREVAPTREKLWEMLESPAVDAKGRAAAATALARGSDSTERTRLRVAAERCAEPVVRARIAEVLEEAEVLAEAKEAEATRREALNLPSAS